MHSNLTISLLQISLQLYDVPLIFTGYARLCDVNHTAYIGDVYTYLYIRAGVRDAAQISSTENAEFPWSSFVRQRALQLLRAIAIVVYLYTSSSSSTLTLSLLRPPPASMTQIQVTPLATPPVFSNPSPILSPPTQLVAALLPSAAGSSISSDSLDLAYRPATLADAAELKRMRRACGWGEENIEDYIHRSLTKPEEYKLFLFEEKSSKESVGMCVQHVAPDERGWQ